MAREWSVMILFFALFMLSALCQKIDNTATYNVSGMWNTLRPNLYFGVRARQTHSPLFGIMWYNMDIAANKPHQWDMIRHECSESDHLKRYSWIQHDGCSFGTQEIVDRKMKMTTSFIKRNSITNNNNDDDDCESWIARISATYTKSYNSKNNKPLNMSFIWYLAVQDSSHYLDIGRYPSRSGKTDGPFEIQLRSNSIKSNDDEDSNSLYSVTAYPVGDHQHPSLPSAHGQAGGKRQKRRRKKLLKGNYYTSIALDHSRTWNVKELVLIPALKSSESSLLHKASSRKSARAETIVDEQQHERYIAKLENNHENNSTVFLVQQFLTPPFSIDIVFRPSSSSCKEQERNLGLSSEEEHDDKLVTKVMKDASSKFITQFEESFGLAGRGYNKKYRHMASTALSNMIGGIGYFSGSSIISKKKDNITSPSSIFLGPPSELLATVPSRSFFPRGFLWDEGFHLLLVSRWDPWIALDILRHWFGLIDEDGWIAREQILGEEARSRVPKEFVTQSHDIANPPTLFLALDSLLDRFDKLSVSIDSDGITTSTTTEDIRTDDNNKKDFNVLHLIAFLRKWYPKLKLHVDWYLKTQISSFSSNSFRWAGRSLDHCLSSGLDDYPRARWLTNNEGHVDLHSWMVFLHRVMSRISNILKLKNDEEYYTNRSESMLLDLYELHWDEKKNVFFDYALNETSGNVHFIRHSGYVSIFPFLLQLLPASSPKIENILVQISSRNLLWSDYGLRSLALNDKKFFGAGEDYWRGAIWMNINYLAQKALKHYAELEGPFQERCATLHKKLKDNLIQNVFHEFQRTGYLWEQYSGTNGKGRRSHPFTGWTALIVLMMTEEG